MRGGSHWEGLEGMNQYALGIELNNASYHTRVGNQWQAWFKKFYPDNEVKSPSYQLLWIPRIEPCRKGVYASDSYQGLHTRR
jgi:hypothetical protein